MSTMEIKAFVVGLHHHNDGLVFDREMNVSVVFDEENEHSDCAFKVLTEGGLLGGYLAESEMYWGRLAHKLGAKLSFELKAMLNQGYTISEAVVEEIRGRTLRHTKVVLRIVLNEPETSQEPVIEEMEELKMDIDVIGSKQGLFTLVGVQYYTDNLNIGDKVRLTITNNTTYGIDENNEYIGVFPQKDSKCKECYELGLPVTRNSDIKQSEELLAQTYTVVGFITQTKEFKVSKYCVLTLNKVVEEEIASEEVISPMEEDKMDIEFMNERETKGEEYTFCYDCNNNYGDEKCHNCVYYEEEPVVEEEIASEEVISPMEEENMPISEADLSKVLSEDKMLHHKVTRKNELINEAEDLKRKLAVIESGIELLEQEIGEIVERHTLIAQIKANLELLDNETLKTINKTIIENGASSDEEDTTSSSPNDEREGTYKMIRRMKIPYPFNDELEALGVSDEYLGNTIAQYVGKVTNVENVNGEIKIHYTDVMNDCGNYRKIHTIRSE